MRLSHRGIERRLQALMRLWSVIFAAMAILLAFFPVWLATFLNDTGARWFHWTEPLLIPPNDRFFSTLAASLLVILAILAHNAREDLRRRLSAVRVILVSKSISSALYTLAFFTDAPYFAYLVGAIADGAIFLVTFYYYRRARHLL